MVSHIILTTGHRSTSPSALLLLACRDVAAGNNALQKRRDLGIESEIEVLQLDVTDDTLIEKAVHHVESKYHRLDVLMNNAGIIRRPANDSLPALRAAYNDLCTTYLTSVPVVTTAILPLLHLSPSPKVVNITSGLGSIQNTLTQKMARFPAYGASKTGMNGSTVHMQTAENDRVEAEGGKATPKIRFFIVAPGVLSTAGTNLIARGKDPVQGAEAAVRLALDETGGFEGGTCWDFEEGEMRMVPW